MEYFLRNKDKAIEMGSNGHKRVEEEFSLDKMVSSYEGLYMDLTKYGRKPTPS
jgi:glycosyltransferase involved in cell wall biosynthesis